MIALTFLLLGLGMLAASSPSLVQPANWTNGQWLGLAALVVGVVSVALELRRH
jgi:hypothetical protein